MPRYFFDSSSIVKRYFREPGSNWVRAACDTRTRPFLHLSELARVEVVAAIRRNGRLQQVHTSVVDAVTNMFERHIRLSDPSRRQQIYHLVPVTRHDLDVAAQLCSQFWTMAPFPLRSLDAIQLAGAITAKAGTSEEVQFITADARLEAIAQLLGFATDNPLRHP